MSLGVPLLLAYLVLFQNLYKQRYIAGKKINGAHQSSAAATAESSAALASVSSASASAVIESSTSDASTAIAGSVLDEQLFSASMWGKDSVPYWRRNATTAKKEINSE